MSTSKSICCLILIVALSFIVGFIPSVYYSLDERNKLTRKYSDTIQKYNKTLSALLKEFDKNECEVTIIDTTVKLEGKIDFGCHERFLEVIRGKEQDIELLLVTSGGGSSGDGLGIGKWIHENEVKVEVKDYCNSSCANYIFPAGTEKFIQRNSVIGWHGSETKERGRRHAVAVLSDGNYTADEIYKKSHRILCGTIKGFSADDCRNDDISEELELATAITEFYDELGVSEEIMNYGLWGKHADEEDFEKVERAYGNLAEIRDWTITIDKMEEFGIQNITYQGGNENYPNKESKYYKNLRRGLLEDRI